MSSLLKITKSNCTHQDILQEVSMCKNRGMPPINDSGLHGQDSVMARKR